MKKIHMPVILGTARKGRSSENVARYLVSQIEKMEGLSTQLVDVKDHLQSNATTPPWGEGGANETGSSWKDIVEQSDALVLVIPEYNHGYPGELKLLLDSLYSEYKDVPVLLAGVSSGTFGGARVIDHIKPVLIELGMHPVKSSLSFSKVGEAFGEDGSLQDDNTASFVEKVISEFGETVYAFSALRNKEE